MKGWSDEEIQQTKEIIKRAEQAKHPNRYKLDRSVYYFSLILAIVGNIIFSVILLPLLIVSNNIRIFPIIAIIAFSFGILFLVLVKDIEAATIKHHLAISLIIPVTAIINFLIVVNMAFNYSVITKFFQKNNPWIIAIIYTFFFILPYFYHLITRVLKK
jgi:predicted neutral ceramidase superfamily lipid hydrolase